MNPRAALSIVAQAVLIVAGTVVLLNAILAPLSTTAIPPCQEDEIVVGHGDFEHGYWDAYRCVPLDDLSTL